MHGEASNEATISTARIAQSGTHSTLHALNVEGQADPRKLSVPSDKD